jgi:serine protease Do
VELKLLRNGQSQAMALTLGELTADRGAPADEHGQGEGRDGTGFGMSVAPLTREHAGRLGLDITSGVLVTGIQPRGRAADAGLRDGDVIEEVDGKRVDSVEGLRSALRNGDRPALLLVHRNGTTIFLTVERRG